MKKIVFVIVSTFVFLFASALFARTLHEVYQICCDENYPNETCFITSGGDEYCGRFCGVEKKDINYVPVGWPYDLKPHIFICTPHIFICTNIPTPKGSTPTTGLGIVNGDVYLPKDSNHPTVYGIYDDTQIVTDYQTWLSLINQH